MNAIKPKYNKSILNLLVSRMKSDESINIGVEYTSFYFMIFDVFKLEVFLSINKENEFVPNKLIIIDTQGKTTLFEIAGEFPNTISENTISQIETNINSQTLNNMIDFYGKEYFKKLTIDYVEMNK